MPGNVRAPYAASLSGATFKQSVRSKAKRELRSGFNVARPAFLFLARSRNAMNQWDEYRRNARECQRMAENIGNPVDKASWLRLAASWLGMIKDQPNRSNGNADTQEARSDVRWPAASDEDSRASH